jgi:lipopolysaccharide/colanic/teichoic acid biosynthesis glycosyltransferase
MSTIDMPRAAQSVQPAFPPDSLPAPHLRWYPACKVVVEWTATLLLAIPVTLLIASLAVLVKLTSRGRAFYLQRRVGRGGRIFTMIKLRTMIEDSEAKTGPVWCKSEDPRVTPIGSFLRTTHLDELPQIWNVLRGQMSLIGPRPERPEIVARLEATIPNYRDRLALRPGLTGLAQVQLPPDSSDQTVAKKLAFDRYYVVHLSPALDLRITLSTCLYLFSSVLKSLCHCLVGSYRREIERALDQEDLFDEPSAAAAQTA